MEQAIATIKKNNYLFYFKSYTMKEVFSVLLGAVITVITTVIASIIQFNKQTKFEYRNKIKYLFQNIELGINDTERQKENFNLVVKEINLNNLKIPPLTYDPSNTIFEISETVQSDSYFIAFSHLYRNDINWVNNFRVLRKVIVAINSILRNTIELHEKGLQNNDHRKTNFINNYYNLIAKIEAIALSSSQDNQQVKAIAIIVRDFYSNETELDSCLKVHDFLIEPLNEFFKKNSPVDFLIDLGISVRDMKSSYKNIHHHNKQIAKLILEQIESLNNHLDDLKDLKPKIDNFIYYLN